MKPSRKTRLGLVLFALLATQVAHGDSPPPKAAPPQGLPLKQVALFSSGVGYFGRSGQINGASDIELSFRTEQVNDVLKSLVVFDAAGQVKPVTYGVKDSLSSQLTALGGGLDSETSLGNLLRRFQGAQVRVDTKGNDFEGRIVSVNEQSIQTKDGTVIPVEVLNVLTTKGLRATPLNQIIAVKLLDARLNSQMQQSLELMASNYDERRRPVTLHFGAGNSRTVRAGYLLETPVWKTTYRLVLSDENDPAAKPYLQGWAIVENTGDEDWKDVQLSLVSGRPISFIQDLYQPLYVPRPQVAPQVIGSPTPQTYGAALEESKAQAAANTPVASPRASAPGAAGVQGPAGPSADVFDEESGGFGGAKLDRDAALRERRSIAVSASQIAQSVTVAAQGEARGELFEYAIDQPVTIPRQQSALVPIISENIGGEMLSIFDASSSNQYALHGFLLKNTTGLHLMGGPITVFDGGIYGGDAQIMDLRPNEDRLLSYAVDLDLGVGREAPQFNKELVSVSIRSGILSMYHRQRRDMVYTFRNRSKVPKTVLVQQRIEPEFKLIAPEKPDEKTANEYRFKVTVPPGETTKFTVTSERPVAETVGLFDINLDLLINYARYARLTTPARKALEDLVARRRKIVTLQEQIARVEKELNEYQVEQQRIRNNMNSINNTTDLYKRYMTKLNEQETKIETLQVKLATLRDDLADAQKELRSFVDKLVVEEESQTAKP